MKEEKWIHNLLPCPFCGEMPVVSNGKVKCMNSYCNVQPRIKNVWLKEYIHEAIKEWNVRSVDIEDIRFGLEQILLSQWVNDTHETCKNELRGCIAIARMLLNKHFGDEYD